MPKNDNAHSVRLLRALEKFAGDDKGKDFVVMNPLSKSANIDKKFSWAEEVCTYLENNFDHETIVKVRKACRCNDGKSIANKINKYLKKSDDLKSFTDAFNKSETFASIQYMSDNNLLFIYPQCYCACVKRVKKELSKSWCYCTLGNVQCIFEEVFNKEVRVELLESIKSGCNRCVIDVKW